MYLKSSNSLLVYVCVHMCNVCTYICMYIRTYVCIYLSSYACMHVCACAFAYKYIDNFVISTFFLPIFLSLTPPASSSQRSPKQPTPKADLSPHTLTPTRPPPARTEPRLLPAPTSSSDFLRVSSDFKLTLFLANIVYSTLCLRMKIKKLIIKWKINKQEENTSTS